MTKAEKEERAMRVEEARLEEIRQSVYATREWKDYAQHVAHLGNAADRATNPDERDALLELKAEAIKARDEMLEAVK